jgi:hypothetical protein
MASKLAQRAQSIRARYQARASKIEGTAIEVGSGLMIGSLENAGKLPPTVLGMPSKLGLGLILEGVGAYASGSIARMAHHAGTAFLTCYAYAAGKTGQIVAGTDDFFDDDEDEGE